MTKSINKSINLIRDDINEVDTEVFLNSIATALRDGFLASHSSQEMKAFIYAKECRREVSYHFTDQGNNSESNKHAGCCCCVICSNQCACDLPECASLKDGLVEGKTESNKAALKKYGMYQMKKLKPQGSCGKVMPIMSNRV